MNPTHLDHLSELLRNSVQAGTPEMRACVTAVAAEAYELYAGGREDDSTCTYFKHLVADITRLRGAALGDIRIGCLLDASKYLYLIADNLGSIAASKHALDLSREVRERALEWRAHQLLGIAYSDSMNVSLAIEHFVDGIKIAEELRDTDAMGTLAVDVAVAYNAIGQHEEARDCLKYALRQHGDGPQKPWYTAAMTHYADTLLQLEHFSKGLEAIEKAVASAGPPLDAHDIMAALVREAVYVRLLHKLDRIHDARQRTNQARALADVSKSSRAIAKIDLLEAMCDVHEQNFDVGISRLARRLEATRRAGVMVSIQRELLGELCHANDLAGDPRKAHNALSEQQEVMRRSGQEETLKHHRQHMERVGMLARRSTISTGAFERRKVVLQGKLAEIKLAEIDRFEENIEWLERSAASAELGIDPSGGGDADHIYRVGRFAALIAEESGLPDTPQEIKMIEIAARLHDIGMSFVPRPTLQREASFTSEDRRLVERHALHGAELLANTSMPQLAMAIDVARHHHERWDGGGYSANLSGSAIPFAARVTAIADVFDSLRHKRRYRAAWSLDAVMEYLAQGRGTHFDPQLLDCAVSVLTRLRRESEDLDAALTTQERLARASVPWRGLASADESIDPKKSEATKLPFDFLAPVRDQ